MIGPFLTCSYLDLCFTFKKMSLKEIHGIIYYVGPPWLSCFETC